MRNELNMFYHSGTCWLPVKKKVATASLVFFFFLLVSALVFLGWIDISIFSGTTYSDKPIQRSSTEKSPKGQEFPLKCTKGNKKQTCPKNYYPATTHNPDHPISSSSNRTCPSYFRWIHEDLRPWKHPGIKKGKACV
ncbi:hypothetical protein CMV_018174 [Castanea mollissima]|uniref:Glycosyl transferase CAP10 domain-containing protein n=1 Tax=Castanea mollissima TaxID=60419 RepID=A0A8J4R3T1_9ROSI|nr:hypothetical protein CMV_018174 [Castanea mollissima]